MNVIAGNTRTYQVCPKKEEARRETIISIYRKLFDQTVPVDRQYWTMCSGHTSADGSFSYGSELGQMLSEELITPEQFYGVDIVESIIKANRKAFPQANWIHDDFVTALKGASFEKWFNPAVVNADFISMNRKATVTVTDILELLTYKDIRDTMIVANVMYNNPYGDKNISKPLDINPDELLEGYLKHNVFKLAWNKGGWQLYPDCYYYHGTGKNSRTIMATIVFYRK